MYKKSLKFLSRFRFYAVGSLAAILLNQTLFAQPAPPPPVPTPTPPPVVQQTPQATPGPVTTPPAAPGAANEPPDKFKPLRARTRVTFNLEDAQLPELVRLISQMTGKRFIMPGKSRPISATVYAPTKVTVAEAYQAFLSILQINGMTVVPAGRYLKIVETAGIEGSPLPVYSGTGVPGDDRYVTHIYRVTNASADDLSSLLGKFKSKEGSIMVYGSTNSLIITDTGTNIRRLMRIIRGLDISRTGEQIWIEPVHHANASDIAKLIEELFPKEKSGSGAGGGASPSNFEGPTGSPTSSFALQNTAPSSGGQPGKAMRITKILADDRTNSLIIVATEPAYLRILELLRELDKPQAEGDGRVHVHYLQNGEAEEIATTLNSIVGGGGGGGGATPAAGAKPAAGGGGGEGARVFEGQIKISPHKAANALVITSSLHDYASLRKVIDRLDAPRRQVFLEAVILELSVDRVNRFGVSGHGGLMNEPRDGALTVLGFQAKNTALPGPWIDPQGDFLSSLALGVRGQNLDGSQNLVGVNVPAFGVAITAIANSSDVNVLSTPHVLATDNQEAEITVGENVATQTSAGGFQSPLAQQALAAGAGGQAAGGNLAGLAALGGQGFGIAPRADVGTKVTITPHVNESDYVRLDISEEISELAGQPQGTLGVNTIAKRSAKTKLSVKDAQTVVIGGLMRDAMRQTKTKIPILGDIPLLGMLFRHTNTEKKKTNLMLILTPYIVRSADDMRRIYERKMRERQEFLDRYFVFSDNNYQPPLDYSRTRGLLAEISNELRSLAEEQKLQEESELRKPTDHQPRQPVGVPKEDDTTGLEPGDQTADAAGLETAPVMGAEAGAEPPTVDAEKLTVKKRRVKRRKKQP